MSYCAIPVEYMTIVPWIKPAKSSLPMRDSLAARHPFLYVITSRPIGCRVYRCAISIKKRYSKAFAVPDFLNSCRKESHFWSPSGYCIFIRVIEMKYTKGI